ncbi:MAG: beta-lactamase family protein [Proteobacteria bacterium]|nr:beta-lactamase family protein [Pseudomonadota bacterium]
MDAAIEGDAAPATTSVLVIHRGALVHERYFNGADADTLHNTRSLTKSVTALLVGAAIDRGLIDGVDAPVYDFFADRGWANPAPAKARFTVEDLLTMSAQWECNDDNQFSAGNEERMYLSADWVQFALDLPMKGYAAWSPRPEESPYGRAFSYCTANPVVLGAILERSSGQSLARFAADALEGPLDITRAQWQLTSEGVGMGGGGAAYRSRDLARLGQLLVDGGRWQGRQIVPERWIDAMTTPHAQAREDADYGYLTWRFRFDVGGTLRDAWAMSGNGGNYVFALPEEALVVVITRTRYNQRGMHQESQRLMTDYILKALPPRR